MILALAAGFLVSGVLDIPLWYGMSTGASACIAALAEISGMNKNTNTISRRASWFGLIAGATSFLIGFLIYIATWIWAMN